MARVGSKRTESPLRLALVVLLIALLVAGARTVRAQQPECEWGTLINGFLVITAAESQAHTGELPLCVHETPLRTSKLYGLDLPAGQFGEASIEPGPGGGGFVAYRAATDPETSIITLSFGGRDRTPHIIDTQVLDYIEGVEYFPGPGVVMTLPDGRQLGWWSEPDGMVFSIERQPEVAITMEELATRLIVLPPDAPEVGNSPGAGKGATWPPILLGATLAVLTLFGAAAVVRRA